MTTAPPRASQTSRWDIFAYATGDGANSLVMNTFFAFAMLYYTKAMGMSGTYAGIAMGIVTLWDAITDPLMGLITDNTRSRFGRRHPYMLIGGIMTVLCFYGIWTVPSEFRTPDLWVLSGGREDTLKLWDAGMGQEIRTFDRQGAAVTAVAFSPDGQTALSGGADGTLRLWDVTNGAEVRVWQGHEGPVRWAGFSPDGKWVASAGGDNILRLSETETGEVVRTFETEGSSIYAAAFSPDGKRLVLSGEDGILRLWSTESGQEVKTFEGHSGSVHSVVFSLDGKWILSASEDTTVKLWNAESGEEIRTFEGHDGPVYWAALSRDGGGIVSASEDGTLKLWDTKTGLELKTQDGHDGPARYVAFSRYGKRIASWGDDETLRVWDTETWQPLQAIQMPASHNAIAFHSKTKMALFWYLVLMNLLLRTGATVFAVPYIALGFEVCTDYNQRTTLQGVRTGLNMAVNLLGPAILVWSVFLRDRGGLKGELVAANYEHMGLTFAIVAMCFVLFVVFATRKYAVDTRHQTRTSGGTRLHDILRDLADVVRDPYPRTVFLFIAVLFIGVVLVTSLQMFVYVDFMEFAGWEKSLVHGSTMVAAGTGALLCSSLVRRFDKKAAIYILLVAACVGNIILVLLFATGWVPRSLSYGMIPIATLVFLLFHSAYHLGSTAATTVANSMMADVSEISRYRTGVLKDGAYSAMLSFVLKMSISFGLVLCGFCLDWIGVDQDAEHQTPEVARHLMYAAFLGGTAITLLAMMTIARYPVNRAYMVEIKAALAEGRGKRLCVQCGCDLEGNVSGICPQCGRPAEPGLGPPPGRSAGS